METGTKVKGTPFGMMHAKRAQQSEINYRQCCVDYIKEHGPTPRRVALPGMAQRYSDNHTTNIHKAPEPIRLRMAVQLQEVERDGLLIKGARPQQILTLPTS